MRSFACCRRLVNYIQREQYACEQTRFAIYRNKRFPHPLITQEQHRMRGSYLRKSLTIKLDFDHAIVGLASLK